MNIDIEYIIIHTGIYMVESCHVLKLYNMSTHLFTV